MIVVCWWQQQQRRPALLGPSSSQSVVDRPGVMPGAAERILHPPKSHAGRQAGRRQSGETKPPSIMRNNRDVIVWSIMVAVMLTVLVAMTPTTMVALVVLVVMVVSGREGAAVRGGGPAGDGAEAGPAPTAAHRDQKAHSEVRGGDDGGRGGQNVMMMMMLYCALGR